MSSTDRSAEARSAKADLGDVIDYVAGRMVDVPDNPDMLPRIVSALPDRSTRLRWLIPQFAALAAVAIVVLLWSTREQPASPAVLSSTEIAAITAFPGVTPRAPSTFRTLGTLGTQPAAPPAPPEPLTADFDRSLPALELSAIGPSALPAVEALTLAPIEIGELPLTAETTSPNQF